ncbi:hypothetical protein [Veronia pacifica]|uniref:DUF445 domain-containing protein n=1 Tax=Veronia pacifica TaxID=1080227 RepID=A0A1C3ES13_9GAMM|nr:hypothetical protein [Veronia pacifica]ODA36047.1 hypothetical protein A8L45_00080 [Veronia pacifica]
MNKSTITNLIALTLFVTGLVLDNKIATYCGIFALSGALTNLLAVHMLFEKVPGLYGSGVVQNRFMEIRNSGKTMILGQFFSSENVTNYIKGKTKETDGMGEKLTVVINKLDLDPMFDSFITAGKEGPLGHLIAMAGGEAVLETFRESVTDTIRTSLIDFVQNKDFQESLVLSLTEPEIGAAVVNQVEELVDKRLEQLSPEVIKEITHKIIHNHLGWLVVWGGVFGGFIGIFSGFIL